MSQNTPKVEESTSDQNTTGIRKSTRIRKVPQNKNSHSTSKRKTEGLSHTHSDSTAVSSNPLPSPTALEDDAPGPSSTGAVAKETAGKLRNWKPWDPTTEYLFFDALKMFGKDYDSITKYIAQKTKSANAKNYEQVRNYYHNTTSKLLAMLNLTEINASKEVKELFTLINYGEWKRKTNNTKLNAKCIKIFSGLVLNGCATIKMSKRASGKAIGRNKLRTRLIRTPLCPALKKFIDGPDDVSLDTNLPKTVAVEFLPCNQRDHTYVLGCRQNPLIRFMLNLNQPIGEVLRWLQQKWVPHDLRMKKTMLGEDISQELASITLYPSSEMNLRSAQIRPLSSRVLASSSSNPTSIGAGSSSVVYLGLRHCFGSGDHCVSSEQRRPVSPTKNDRKRKGTDGGHSSTVRKRIRSVVAASSPEQNPCDPAARQFSDGGEGENSSDNCPVASTGVTETDDEGAECAEPVTAPSGTAVLESSDNNAPLQQQSPTAPVSGHNPCPGLILDPDELRQGISSNANITLTAGQLYLMCGKAAPIRLKYSITPKTSTSTVDGNEAWRMFVDLVRSDFATTLQKKLAIPANPSAKKRPYGGNLHKNVPVTQPRADDKPLSLALDRPDAATQSADPGLMNNDPVFAKPAVGRVTNKVPAHDPPSTSFPSPHSSVAGESNAFLAQMGQMVIKRPIMVNRLSTIVPPPPASTNSRVMISRTDTADRYNSIPVHAGAPEGIHSFQKSGDDNAASSTDLTSQWLTMATCTAASVVGADLSTAVHSEVQTNSTTTGAMNIDQVHVTTPNTTVDRIISPVEVPQPRECTAAPTGVPPGQQEVVTSDSLFDFSLTSFASTAVNSKSTTEKNPLLGGMSSLQLEEDTALSSPPRPIRVSRLDKPGKVVISELSSSFDAHNCASTSNLFPLFDGPVYNESSTTRELFADCAATTATLETPEKRRPQS